MKQLISRVCMLLVCAVLVGSPAVVLADGVCSSMKIVHIGVTPTSPSGADTFLKNETGAACGSIAAGATVHFNLPTTNTDQTLALMLTAASLKKPVWTYYVGTSEPFTLAFLTVNNITD